MKVENAREIVALALAAAETRADQPLSWLLKMFLEQAEAEWSEAVENIRISSAGDRRRVSWNKSFVEKYLTAPDDALFVLLHEIMHQARGNPLPGLDPGKPVNLAVMGLVEDILINARLCKLYFPQAAPFFQKLYPPDRFPDILLLPPMILDQRRVWHEHGDKDYAGWEYSGFEEMYPWLRNVLVYPAFEEVENLPEALIEEKDYSSPCPLWQYKKKNILPGLIEWYLLAWTRPGQATLASLYDPIHVLLGEASKTGLIGSHSS